MDVDLEAAPNRDSTDEVDRRRFLMEAGGALLAGSSALSAKSYARVPGANDRIRLAQDLNDMDFVPQHVVENPVIANAKRLVSAARVANDAAKVPSELKDVAPKLAYMRYNALESAGQADFEGKEGDPGILEMPTGYRAEFKFGEYDPASDSVRVSELRLSRLQQKDQLTPVLKPISLNLRLGQTYVVGATRSAESQHALIVVIIAHR